MTDSVNAFLAAEPLWASQMMCLAAENIDSLEALAALLEGSSGALAPSLLGPKLARSLLKLGSKLAPS